jgi:transposase, IS5 family
VRVRSRTLTNARNLLQATPALAGALLRDRTRRATRQMQRILEAARPRGPEAADRRPIADQRLLDSARATVRQAQQAGPRRRTQTPQAAQRVAVAVDPLGPLADQVVTQTTRRVRQGETVSASAKVVSLFAPHTAMIRKGTPGPPTECGRVIWLDEVEGGLSSRDAVLEGHPAEAAHWPPSLDHPRQVCNHPPRRLAGDRGVYPAANER